MAYAFIYLNMYYGKANEERTYFASIRDHLLQSSQLLLYPTPSFLFKTNTEHMEKNNINKETIMEDDGR